MLIGPTLDRLGVEADIEDTDLIASAVVVLTMFSEGDSRPRLVIANSENISWIEQAGMLRLAEKTTSDVTECEDED